MNAVALDPATYAGNNASRDAFYASLMNQEVNAPITMDMTLTRPFAQLNIITTDLTSADQVDVSAGMKVEFTAPTKFNVANGAAFDPQALVSSTTSMYGTTAEGKTPVTMDYVFVTDGEKELINISYIANGIMAEPRVFTNVPVERNYRTNLVGDLFTAVSTFNVDLDQNWGDAAEKNIYVGTVASLAELKSIFSGAEYERMNITLTADINITDANLTIPASVKEVVINGNGRKIQGSPLYTNAETVVFSNVVFANATEVKKSCVYSIGNTKNLTFDACTFTDHDWDAVQVTNNTIESVTFDKCVFSATTAYQRYIHLQVSAVNETAQVVITNCEFYDLDKVNDSAITIYGFRKANMNISGNKVYGPVNSDMFWISDAFDASSIFTDAELASMFEQSAVALSVNAQDELNAAIAAAAAGDVIKIATAGTYKLPNIPANITIVGMDGVVIDAIGSGSIASVPNGATFEGLEFNFGQSTYHGFQHAGTINMKGCTLNGLFFSYGVMNFDQCTFIQNAAEYHMWMYGTTVTYNDCTFKGQGKFINVYNEGDAYVLKVVCNNCYFESGVSKKAALNIKETCGSKLLKIEAEINNCTTNANFPAASTSDALYVASSVWQVDDRYTSDPTKSNVKVTVDGEVKYINGQPVL